MKPDRYIWAAISVIFCSLGGDVLIDSVRHSGPYGEEYILFGGTLAALGLVAMFFALEQRAHVKGLSQHMRHSSRPSGRSKTANGR